MRQENKGICTESDAINEELKEYCRRVIGKFKPICIILYGSRAKGTFTPSSDIDIIVLSDNFENDFLSRIKDLIDINSSTLPIEPLGYTKVEFETMLRSYKITALDSILEGKPLFGEDYFNNLKKTLHELEKTGLYKGKTSWHLPSAAIESEKALV
ncbi:MAG: nucleotidyltransferase domain-containing protein [Candidatus Methanoperedens sp.]